MLWEKYTAYEKMKYTGYDTDFHRKWGTLFSKLGELDEKNNPLLPRMMFPIELPLNSKQRTCSLVSEDTSET